MSQGAYIAYQVVQFYIYLVIAYVLMSWLRPTSGLIADIYRVLGSIVEPFIGIFRRFIPPIGMIDVSPIAAFLVLRLIQQVLLSL